MAHQFDLPTNRLYQIRDDLIRRKRPFTDLISGNVNAQQIIFPQDVLQRATAAGIRSSRIYHPHPLGQLSARKAISRVYTNEGLKVLPEQILLTPGTSVSYWYAFKLLADAGDEILAPAPSYPLFDSISGLCGIKLVPYRLRENVRWEIDFGDLEAAITPRTKAIVLISPHNPTGAVATPEEVRRLGEIATRRGIAIISDEVFSSFVYTSSFRRKPEPSALGPDFRRGDGALPRPAATSAPLVLTMNGLSKRLGLPGMKIGWMAVTGDPSKVKQAMKTLEMISDTFLPVNEPAQFALPAILTKSGKFQKTYAAAIHDRLTNALKWLQGATSISCVKPEGGFFLTIRLDRTGANEEDIACKLLEERKILVHPGYFYDLEGHHLVMSFVSRTTVLRKAIQTILRGTS